MTPAHPYSPMGALARLVDARSRSISAENPTGAKGRGGMALPEEGIGDPRLSHGQGWKVSPAAMIQAGETCTIADVEGPGAIQQMWFTQGGGMHRFSILRIYWDDQEQPSVECPLGDFFASGWGRYAQLSSLAVCVNPRSGFNCYWEMPFRRRARVTLENIGDTAIVFFYQINYELRDVPEDAAYFHAQFRRTNPVPWLEPHTLLDGVEGRGHYVGTYLAWGSNNNGWWGEGELKFHLDGDEWPTICGTGTEDYVGGSWDFEDDDGQYRDFTTPYSGLHQIIRPNGLYRSQQRFGMYRWHVADPIRFERDLRVTVQALGGRDPFTGPQKLVVLQDDVASVAYWYQTLPTAPFPALLDRDRLEVVTGD